MMILPDPVTEFLTEQVCKQRDESKIEELQSANMCQVNHD